MSMQRPRSAAPSLVVLAFVCLALTTIAEAVPKLDARLVQPLVEAGAPSTSYLRVALLGSQGCAARAPVNLALVIDRSRSMQGVKMRHARQAAAELIAMLGPDDIVAVVTYQSTVEVLIPATAVTDQADLIGRLDELRADGDTALFAGLAKGIAEIRQHASPRRINRIVLLSDGLPNVGPRAPSELRALARSLRRDGISITTIGLDRDYDEDLMVQLAAASDANHVLVEDTTTLARVLQTELHDLFAAVAGRVTIRVDFTHGARPLRSLGRHTVIAGTVVTAELSQLYSGQDKYILLEVELPAGRAGETGPVARVTVDYSDLVTGEPARQQQTVEVAYTADGDRARASAEAEIELQVVQQIGSETTDRAIALVDSRRFDAARELLRDNAAFLGRYAAVSSSADLHQSARRNRDAAEHIGGPGWPRVRKDLRRWQHRIATQQSY